MPFFSIIIPTFNSARTIERCIESIIKQDWVDYEIIVQDGGSTDQTKSLVQRFGDRRIIFNSETDEGVYDAMNKALRRARGDWFLFLGSDDALFEDHTLSSCAPYLTCADSKLVYGNVMIDGGTLWAKDGEIYKGEIPLEDFLRHNICHQSIFYHHTLFAANNEYNTQYAVCADYDFNLRTISTTNPIYIPLTIARFAGGGLSSTQGDPNFELDKWSIIVAHYGWKIANSKFKVYKKKIRETASRFIKEGDVKSAIRALIIYIKLKF